MTTTPITAKPRGNATGNTAKKRILVTDAIREKAEALYDTLFNANGPFLSDLASIVEGHRKFVDASWLRRVQKAAAGSVNTAAKPEGDTPSLFWSPYHDDMLRAVSTDGVYVVRSAEEEGKELYVALFFAFTADRKGIVKRPIMEDFLFSAWTSTDEAMVTIKDEAVPAAQYAAMAACEAHYAARALHGGAAPVRTVSDTVAASPEPEVDRQEPEPVSDSARNDNRYTHEEEPVKPQRDATGNARNATGYTPERVVRANAERAAARAAARAGRRCEVCGKRIVAARSTARFCCPTCRSKAWRVR
jgi:hypothetical protein